MLGSRKKEVPVKKTEVGLGASSDTCVVSKGAEFEGKFKCKENLRLDGKVKGEVICDSRLVMGETGGVNGTVRAKEAVILGSVEGDLFVAGPLVLKSTAKIKGNITAKTMSVDEGAIYNGECKIGEFAATSSNGIKKVVQKV